jgi:predicted DNA binding CopG/RHH family protein
MPNKLTEEEKGLLESYENDEWVSVQTDKNIEKYQAVARETFKKDKRVNIRISGKDLELLQERALIEGIPYQTLMSSVLHKFVYGNLIDKSHKKQSKTDA